MPYTLMKGLIWILLALLLGIVIGWLLRSVTARRQIIRARAHNVDMAELERLRGRVANLEPIVAERDRLLMEQAASSTGEYTQQSDVAAEPPPIESASPPARPDVETGRAVLGRPIELDDLKVVEGIGPKIEELCHGIGIRTWWDLSTTEVSLLRTMLDDAGTRFRTQEPGTWPEQAKLLASGRWDEFRALTERLVGGSRSD